MKILEGVRLAWRALIANKLRAGLTMLGIIIGVGAVIALMSVGDGVQNYITDRFKGIGAHLLFIFPGSVQDPLSGAEAIVSNRGAVLTVGDAEALADPLRVPDLVAVAPELTRFGRVSVGTEEALTQVSGVVPEFMHVRTWYPVVGEFIGVQDVENRSRVVVLGQTVVETLFPNNPYPVGETVKVNNIAFRVIGVMEEKGGATSFADMDDIIFIPLTTAQTRLFPSRTLAGERGVSAILGQVVSDDRIEAVKEQVSTVLRERHNIAFRDEDDFSIISQAGLINVFGEIMNVITIFLGSIAAISLVVGGIGIMNIMLVSVTERTREIGLRKSVGARQRDILWQFLIEAVSLAILGGAIGIGVGALGAAVVTHLIGEFQAELSPDAVLLATTVSAFVGLASGIYPAWRAARLNPIDALRYE
ncbi:MAG: ABC transporter permease [Chloroflexota bacterium]|nr:ABC transporter permease [Chloroflexota bacterium]